MPAPARKALRMPALAVTRTETRWHVTFADPPINLVDPEMIIEHQTLVDQLEHDPDVTVVFDSADADHFLGPYEAFFDSAARQAAGAAQ
jgi:hypothetical protein